MRLPLPDLDWLRLGNNRNWLGNPKGSSPALLVSGWVRDQHTVVLTRVIKTHTVDSEICRSRPHNLLTVSKPLIRQRLGTGHLDLEGDTRPGRHQSILRFCHKFDRYVDDHLSFITGDGTPFV